MAKQPDSTNVVRFPMPRRHPAEATVVVTIPLSLARQLLTLEERLYGR